MKKRIEYIAYAIIFLIIYYGFLMGFALDIKDSAVEYLESHNLTKITINEKIYNKTTNAWEDKPVQFDLTGFLDIIMVLAILFAPLIIIIRVAI